MGERKSNERRANSAPRSLCQSGAFLTRRRVLSNTIKITYDASVQRYKLHRPSKVENYIHPLESVLIPLLFRPVKTFSPSPPAPSETLYLFRRQYTFVLKSLAHIFYPVNPSPRYHHAIYCYRVSRWFVGFYYKCPFGRLYEGNVVLECASLSRVRLRVITDSKQTGRRRKQPQLR